MAGRYCYNEVLPLTALIAVECLNVGLNVLFKEAASKGMSQHVFITYTYALGALFLLPLSFIFPSGTELPSLRFHIASRIFLLGLIDSREKDPSLLHFSFPYVGSYLGQICAYKGIDYSSPTLASAIDNLSPAFTFILAVLFRLERVALRSSSSQAKIMGTIASISGALLFVLYKGPEVLPSLSSSSSSSDLLRWPLESSDTNWVIGGILLAVAYLLFSIWYIVQTQVIRSYPAELTVSLLYNLCGTIISAPVSLIAESELSSWMLRPSVAVIAVLYSGFFQSYSSVVVTWGLHLKGPVYIAVFSPLSIAIAAFMSAIFLGDSLHLGSVIGAIIISMGFYAVIWGKAKEGERSSSGSKVPLLKV